MMLKRIGTLWGLAALGIAIAMITVSTPASAAPKSDSVLGWALCGLYSLQKYPAKACGTAAPVVAAPKAAPAPAPKAAPAKPAAKPKAAKPKAAPKAAPAKPGEKPAAKPTEPKKSDVGPLRGPSVTTSPPLTRS